MTVPWARLWGLVGLLLGWALLSTPAQANSVEHVQSLSFGRFASIGGEIVLPTWADSLEGAVNVTGAPRRGIITVNRSTESTATAILLAPVGSIRCGSVYVPISIRVDDSECAIRATGRCRIFVGATLRTTAATPAVTCEALVLDWQVDFQ